MCAQLHSCVFVAPWTVACQAPLSMGFSRQEYWSGLPSPSPGDLPGPGIDPRFLHLLHWRKDPLPPCNLRSPLLRAAGELIDLSTKGYLNRCMTPAKILKKPLITHSEENEL